MSEFYIIELPISEAQADAIGMPRLIFEKAVKQLGYRQTSVDLLKRMQELRVVKDK